MYRIYKFFSWWDGKHSAVRGTELDLTFLKTKLPEIRSFTCFTGHILEVFLRDLAN